MLKVISLLFLILKATLGLGQLSNMSCCEDNAVIMESTCDTEVPVEENKGCCDDNKCECLCCINVFINSPKSQVSVVSQMIEGSSDFEYHNLYQHQKSNLFWHPPQSA